MRLHLDYPPVTRGPVILWGMLGAMPFGGMVWQVYHYAVPLRRLGYDVWYVEDSDSPVYDPVSQEVTMECAANVALLAGFMDSVGLGDRWVFRAPGTRDEVFGGTDHRGLLELYRNAEFALNLCGAQEPLEHHASIPCRIYLETDPVRDREFKGPFKGGGKVGCGLWPGKQPDSG